MVNVDVFGSEVVGVSSIIVELINVDAGETVRN